MRFWKLVLIGLLIIFLGCRDESQMKSSKTSGYAQSNEFKLAKPIAIYESALFSESTVVKFQLSHPNTKIYYTLDGSLPDSESQLYSSPIHFEKSSKIIAKAYHPNLLPSDQVEVSLIKTQKVKVSEVYLNPEPNERYSANGAESLFDLQKGSFSHRDGRWLGFNEENINVIVKLENSQPINQIQLSALSAHGAWIFLPSEVILKINGEKMRRDYTIPTEESSTSFEFISFELDDMLVNEFEMEIKGLQKIPDWHSGRGTTPWTFIDEIIVN